MNFSQRMKLSPVPEIIQINGINNELRASLWNVLWTEEFGRDGFLYQRRHYPARILAFTEALWADYFKLPIDSRPTERPALLEAIRRHYFKAEWHKAYDFIEFCIDYYGERIIAPLNKILARELAGYRIINGRVAPISSPEETASIQGAIDNAVFPGASAHLRSALDLLSRKMDPDYRNSIKESISAVESACCAILGDGSASLGAALKELAKKHSLHPALKDGFSKLYGYTSDSDGIRHAMLDEPQLSQADAVYFLVACSAFINYLAAIRLD